MARIRSGPQGLVFRTEMRGELVTLFLEAEDTDEIIVVMEMPAIEAIALAAKLLMQTK